MVEGVRTSPLGGSMLELGMWVPRQSQDRIRTLHACVLGDCLINDV